MDAKAAERSLLRRAGAMIDKNLIREFKAQGHSLTGAWERSLQGTLVDMGRAVILHGEMNQYGVYLEYGVAASEIKHPLAPARIKGLIAFWEARGVHGKDAVRAAYATAIKHSKEGMPTADSYAYSENGARKHFASTVEKAIQPVMDAFLGSGLDEIIDQKFRETKSETI